MKEGRSRPFGGGGDPLAAMYFIAAILMAVGSLVVVALAFVPRDLFSGGGGEDVVVPGSGEVYVPFADQPVDSATAAARAAEAEEMHYHDH